MTAATLYRPPEVLTGQSQRRIFQAEEALQLREEANEEPWLPLRYPRACRRQPPLALPPLLLLLLLLLLGLRPREGW